MLKIEQMKSEYLDEIIELGLSTPEFQTGTDAPQFYSKETLTRWIRSPNGILLIALENKDLIGFSITAYNPDSRDGYIHCIAINQNYQGKGIGSKLLNQTLDELERMSCNHVYCLVNLANEDTKNFFKKHGFRVGEAFNYVQRTLPR